VERMRSSGGENVLVFAHGHLLRMVAVTWIDAPWPMAWRLPIDPATISILGWDRGTAVLERWNS
jgi:broad specificity phosphatase PhoE